MSAYRFLGGVPLGLSALAGLSDSARARALEELAGMINALRRVPVEEARAAGVRVRQHEGFGHPSQRHLHHRHGAQLGKEAVTRIEVLWRAYEAERDGGAVPDTLIHADLKPEHVLHDPNSGQITAVLDWGDARHAGLMVAVRWLCDLDVGAIDGDDRFLSMCAASLREHLASLG